MTTRMLRRILLADLAAAEADGWSPIVLDGTAVGCDPFAAGTQAAVLVERVEHDDDARERVRRSDATWLDATGLGKDELRVVMRIIDRMRFGQRQYGALDVAGNPKDWRAERTEELLDAAVYSACQSIRDEDNNPR